MESTHSTDATVILPVNYKYICTFKSKAGEW